MNNTDASSETRVLLVEGQDDLSVVRNVCAVVSNLPEFCIIAKGDWVALRRGIRGEILAEGRTAVGILADANNSLDGRWQAIVDRLNEAGITAPARPLPRGTIIDSRPRVGIWVIPDNISDGELEDFVAGMIPPADPVWPLSGKYIDGIPAGHRKFRDGKIVRAKVHAWLAARRRPRLMGTAIEAGDLDTSLTQAFQNWLRDLFGGHL